MVTGTAIIRCVAGFLVAGALLLGPAAVRGDADVTWVPTCSTKSVGRTGFALCQGKAPGQEHRAVALCQWGHTGWPMPLPGHWTTGAVASATCPYGLLVAVSYELRSVRS